MNKDSEGRPFKNFNQGDLLKRCTLIFEWPGTCIQILCGRACAGFGVPPQPRHCLPRLEPENVLIEDNGHIMLVDFDLLTKLPVKSPNLHRPPQSPPATQVPATEQLAQNHKRKKTRKGNFVFRSFSYNAGVSPVTTDESQNKSPMPPHKPAIQSYESTEKSNSFVGTEDYVVPEIIQGKGHDFLVDWWGLGLVLYKMLYGRTPFRGINLWLTHFTGY